MDASQYPETIFTPELIDRVGEIGVVLGEFLDDQTTRIQSDLEKAFPNVSPDAIHHVLNSFITLEGTKRPQSKNQIHISTLSEDELNFCLERLEKARILRYEDGVYELAHDTLAKSISEQRSVDEVAFLEVIKMVRDRFSLFQSTQTLLNMNELQLIKGVEGRLKREESLSKKEWEYIGKSQAGLRRRRLFIWSVLSVIIIILAGFSIYSYRQRGLALEKQAEAEEAQRRADENLQLFETEQTERALAQYQSHLANGKALMSESNYLQAIQEFNTALAFKEDDQEAIALKAQCEQLTGVRERFEALIQAGDRFAAQGDRALVDARNRYQQALQLNYDNTLAQSRIIALSGKLEAAYDKFVQNAETFFRVEGYRMALDNYEQATRIKPGSRQIVERIQVCREKLGSN